MFTVQTLPADVYPVLYRDLTERPERVSAFFPLAPTDPHAWRQRAQQVHDLWQGNAASRRQPLADALQAALRRWGGPSPQQQRNLQALRQEDALVVVTGQQPGLLGGPMYTLYKALGAVIEAERASRELGCPVVPVFWIASEDHDWSEMSQAHIVAPDGGLVPLRLGGTGEFRSAGHIPVPSEARHLVGQMRELCPPTASGAALAEHLLDGLRRPGRVTLADWFGWQLQGLLGNSGLLFYDPMQPALRALAAPVFSGAAQRAAEANRRIEMAARTMEAAGYAPGLNIEADHVHLFTYVGGRRLALHAEEGRIRTRDRQVDWGPDELPQRVQADASAFSPNVALRPIVQDFTLPVLAQLGGPGEVAYLAQLRDVFALWERPMPIVGPRPGATLVFPAEREVLERSGATIDDLLTDVQGVVDRAVGALSPVEPTALFASGRERISEQYARLEESLARISPSMRAITRGNAERVMYQVDYLEKKARQHLRRAHRDLVSSIRGAAGRLFPAGGLQERAVGPYPFLFRTGPHLVQEIQEALNGAPGPFGRHWLLMRDTD